MKWRSNFNESAFFSTEVSTDPEQLSDLPNFLRLPQPQALNSARESWKLIDLECTQALKDKIKAQKSLLKTEKDGRIVRGQFRKTYEVKRFLFVNNGVLMEGKTHNQEEKEASMRRTKRLYETERYGKEILRVKQKEVAHGKREASKVDKASFNITLRRKQEEMVKDIRERAYKIKRFEEGLERKNKKLGQMRETQSKFNYLQRMNDEIDVIRAYQGVLNEISHASAEVTVHKNNVSSEFL